MRASCKSYDAGETWEAKRLAVTAHNLLHDGGRFNKSILSQLGILTKINFADSSIEITPGWTYSGTRLVYCQIESDGERSAYIAPLSSGEDTVRQFIKFSQWYDESVFSNHAGRSFSRKNLIFALRSQDGGAHFDVKLKDDAYLQFSVDPGTDFVVSVNGQKLTKLGAHLASMRQIAGEIEITLDRIPIGLLRER